MQFKPPNGEKLDLKGDIEDKINSNHLCTQGEEVVEKRMLWMSVKHNRLGKKTKDNPVDIPVV